MSREIKFRAYDKKLKKMYEPFDLYWKAHQHNPPDSLSGAETFSPNAIFLQFTGLKDKNGVEIYEGDIVDVGELWVKGHTGVVRFGSFSFVTGHDEVWDSDIDDSAHGFYIEHRTETFALTQHNVEDIEVIGNIYFNPELLEGEKDG